MKYCYGCMAPMEAEETVCPHCGFDSTKYHAEAHHLSCGSVLNSRYYIGRVINEGGFGITYCAYDMLLNYKVAIKEFYLFGYVNRNVTVSTNVVPTADETETVLERKQKFICEAQVLAKFNKEKGVVHVRDYCEANETAYIIMEYEPGPNLKEHILNDGTTDSDSIITLMLPLLDSLGKIHNENLIHRDITPDNIMFSEGKELVLIDFGSAREVSLHGTRSLSVVLKPGFAPLEQYNSRGSQGPFTDVYSICATMYFALSGTIPVNSLERAYANEDPLVPLKELVDSCPANFSDVITKGMAIFSQDRYQTVGELLQDLKHIHHNPDARIDIPKPKNKFRKFLIPGIAALAALSAGVILLFTRLQTPPPSAENPTQTSETPNSETTVSDETPTVNESGTSEETKISSEALNEPERDCLFYYEHSFTGYLDELTNWTGHTRFVDADYDGDKITDRVRISMDAELFNTYRLDVEFGDGHTISIDRNFDQSVDPYIQSAHLFGDSRQLVIQSICETSTDPEYCSYFELYSCDTGKKIPLLFDNSEEDTSQYLIWDYTMEPNDTILARSARLNYSTLVAQTDESESDWYNYLRTYPDTSFNQAVYMAGVRTLKDYDALVINSRLFDKFSKATVQFEIVFTEEQYYTFTNPRIL